MYGFACCVLVGLCVWRGSLSLDCVLYCEVSDWLEEEESLMVWYQKRGDILQMLLDFFRMEETNRIRLCAKRRR